MNILKKIEIVVKEPSLFIEWLLRIPFPGHLISDQMAIRILYRLRLKKKIDLKSPKTFNEKLLWLTLHERNSLKSKVCDKYEMKKHVIKKMSSICSNAEEHVVKTIGIYDSFDEIDFNKLPQKYVIKTTHDSGTVFLCEQGKTKLDQIKKQINKSLKRNYYWYTREWQYKDVLPRIIIEEKIENGDAPLKDYKFYCSNGKAKYFLIASDRGIDIRYDYYYMDGVPIPVIQGAPRNGKPFVKPACWDEMVLWAEKLAEDFVHLRVDFYIDNNEKFYVGELTLTDCGGLLPFEPEEYDLIFGNFIDLTVLTEEE